MFDSSPVVSIWLEMYINWHTKSQGPKKKCIHFFRGRINHCPAHTACNCGIVLLHIWRFVQSFFSPTVYWIGSYLRKIDSYHLEVYIHSQYCILSQVVSQNHQSKERLTQWYLALGSWVKNPNKRVELEIDILNTFLRHHFCQD